jgi:hypothetical protein
MNDEMEESPLGPEGCCFPGQCCMPGPHIAEKARDLSIVMGYEAMRICIGQPTRLHDPAEVVQWMLNMIEQGPK